MDNYSLRNCSRKHKVRTITQVSLIYILVKTTKQIKPTVKAIPTASNFSLYMLVKRHALFVPQLTLLVTLSLCDIFMIYQLNNFNIHKLTNLKAF